MEMDWTCQKYWILARLHYLLQLFAQAAAAAAVDSFVPLSNGQLSSFSIRMWHSFQNKQE